MYISGKCSIEQNNFIEVQMLMTHLNFLHCTCEIIKSGIYTCISPIDSLSQTGQIYCGGGHQMFFGGGRLRGIGKENVESRSVSFTNDPPPPHITNVCIYIVATYYNVK